MVKSRYNMKKTLGRRRIPIRKIEKKQSRKASFSKRRAGLFKKASELSALCGSEIAVIVFSKSGKAFSFAHPNAEFVAQRYVNSPNSDAQFACYGIRKFGKDDEVVQWENRIGMLGLNELQLYANWLQKVRDAVSLKASSTSDQNRVSKSDNGNQNSSSDYLLVHDSFLDDVNDHENHKSSSDDDLNVQDCCFDYVNYDQGNKKSSSNDVIVQDNWFNDVNDQGNKKSLIVQDNWFGDVNDQGKQKSSSDEDLNVKDSWYDDVNWEDIESYYMDKSPAISLEPFKAESSYEYMDFGDGTMEHSEAILLPCSSSSCFEVDTEFERSLRSY